MKTSSNARRDWIKKSLLSLGAVAVAPHVVWSRRVENAIGNNSKFLFHNTHFNEYTPPRFPDLNSLKARLMWNENPHGPSKKAAEVFQKEVWGGNHYSWQSLGDLSAKIAEKEGVKPEQVMMGPGSSDLLEKTALVFFQHGGNVVSADPSYMSLVSVAKAAGGSWKSIKLTPDYQHDLDAMEEAIDSETRLVYITNPNNPTATITDAGKLMDFCRRVSKKVPVFIDEAYIELSDAGMENSMAPLVAENKNVLVSRTFSKIHGMAGLRIGYMIGKQETLDSINEITRGGMGVTGPSIAAASAGMDDAEFLDSCRTKLIESRNYFTDYLESRNIDYMPSQTNFVIFPLEMAGDEFLNQVYEREMAVRAFKFWDQDWCRVSMGKMEEMKLFTEALDEILV
ncbi:histidinol-phosphate transaminase [Zunongwangia sp. F363]|uniref:Histidinol-phosphate transaminase n=1 Tax=Autumnicola tepida TaxID=3075595 RepID=A0ABU3CC67_9FLAO|nr:histidinol-phosphate transaminase [Zunongwangia sp. F363]MDT0643812.1 histidinol-phosphate transaminase [Zunongwangia sp. F363]